MKKYYVDFGGKTFLELGHFPVDACRKVLAKYLSAGYVDSLPLIFIVSERGFNFDEHEDYENHLIWTEWVVEFLLTTTLSSA